MQMKQGVKETRKRDARKTKREIAKKRKLMTDQIGRRLILWNFESKEKAYRDHLGVSRRANVVNLEIPVTIVEVRFKDEQDVYGRIIAKSADGEEFFSRRSSDDGPTDTRHWDCPSRDGRTTERYPREFAQATDLYGRLIGGDAFMRPDGSPAVPKGIHFCTEHGWAFMPDDPNGCHRCKWEKESAAMTNNARSTMGQ